MLVTIDRVSKFAFADLKRNLGLTRLRLRGLTEASDQFLLAATVQNLTARQRNLATRLGDSLMARMP